MRPGRLLCAALLCALTQGAVAADESVEIRCLASVGLKKPIRLQFAFPTGKAGQAWVRYENGHARIPLKETGSESVETAPGRPYEFTTTWKELVPGGGTYTVVTQGARIYGFSYRRAKDRKVFEFDENLGTSAQEGCGWK
jgi:hypothetical protein